MKKMILGLVMAMMINTVAADSMINTVNENAVQVESVENVCESYDVMQVLNSAASNKTNIARKVVSNDGANARIRHEWVTTDGRSALIEFCVSVNTYATFATRKRDLNTNTWVNTYIYESNNDQLVGAIAKCLREIQAQGNLSNDEIVLEAINFVQQCIVYQYDSEAKGVTEYPKYPIETFVEGTGDCEDQAMLLAAILRKLGYGTVLIKLPGHIAVGIKCESGVCGRYYNYNGARYYYIETTGTGWGIGQMPEQYIGVNAQLYTVL